MSGTQLDLFGGLFRKLVPPPRPEPVKPAKASGPPPPVKREPDLRGDAAMTKKCVELLAPWKCEELAAKVRVVWSARMQSTAGMAYPARSLIKLNPRLQEFGEAEVDRTLRHELGHLLAHFRAGKRRIAPHGPEWQQACEDLGLKNEARCHTLPLPRKKMNRRHVYRCPVCGVEIRRVQPLRRPSACLACCRKHAGGKFDERFRLVRVRFPI